MEMMKVDLGKVSHKGMVRLSNEDSLLTLELLTNDSESRFFGLYAVADGVGGHEAGEIASSLALRVLTENIVKPLLLPELEGKPSVLSDESILKVLTQAVMVANSEVHIQGQVKGTDMCTTLVTALLVNNTAYIANVGDSRAYLSDGDELCQITADHSCVAVLVAAGKIRPDEVYTHPRCNIITRCLGTQPDIEVDLFTKVLQSGSSLLLCSDGLWEMVRDNEIREVVLKTKSAQFACEKLVEEANKNGGVDNVSVIIVKITE